MRDFATKRRHQLKFAKSWENRRGVHETLNGGFAVSLRVQMQWDDEQTRRFVSFWHAVTSTVGLRRVHAFLHERLADAVGRFQLKETTHHRHVLIEGDFGTGKKTAAALVARLYQVLDWVPEDLDGSTSSRIIKALGGNPETAKAQNESDDDEDTSDTSGGMDAYVSDLDTGVLQQTLIDVPCTMKDFEDFIQDNLKPKLPWPEGTSFFFRVGPGTPKPKNDVDGYVIEELQKHKCFLFIAGDQTHVAHWAALDVMRRREPQTLKLDTLTAHELASITVALIEKRGYSLRKSSATPAALSRKGAALGRGNTGELRLRKSRRAINIEVMSYIVSQRYDDAVIQKRNAHLALDLLQFAIARKNLRMRERGGIDSSPHAPLILTPVDFDVKMESEEERLARRQAVEAELEGTIGWGSIETDGSPKQFLHYARRAMMQFERDQAQDDGTATQQSWNMVVTGNPGVGKTLFSKLVARFLRAYGVLEKDTFIEVNGLELRGEAVGETGPKVQKLFADAAGGAIFIDEAYAIVGDERRADPFGKEAVRMLLTELENARGGTFVVLAGYKDKMTRLLGADPGLNSRFPHRIAIADYSPEEISEIAQHMAHSKGFSFEVVIRREWGAGCMAGPHHVTP